MELVTIIPRQRLEKLNLLGGPTPPFAPPHRTATPLWLALLLKRQRRANILPPPWLSPRSLSSVLDLEKSTASFSPASRAATAHNDLASLPSKRNSRCAT